MLDSIYIGISGLTGYSKGLNVISNNIANLNTTGFKGSTLQFGDLFYRQQLSGGDNPSMQWSQFGTGLHTLGTTTNFQAGELQQTGNALDVAVKGEGYLLVESDGVERLTRAGQLMLDKDGNLVTKLTGRNVMAVGTDGALNSASINGIRTSAPVATTTVTLQGNLSSTASEFTVTPIKVIDSLGGTHALSATFTASLTTPGSWTVEVKDGSTSVGTGTVKFVDGAPDPTASSISLTYTPAGVPPVSFSLSLGANAQSFASGSTSTLTVASQDGLELGTLTALAVDQDGHLVATYSNGQTKKGQQLALARPVSDEDLEAEGNAEYSVRDRTGMRVGRANEDGLGSFVSGQLEGSNVDLATEFTSLIVMQRGYQASSKIVSTANDMIQELFDMKSGR